MRSGRLSIRGIHWYRQVVGILSSGNHLIDELTSFSVELASDCEGVWRAVRTSHSSINIDITTVTFCNASNLNVSLCWNIRFVVSGNKVNEWNFCDLDFASRNPFDTNSISFLRILRVVSKLEHGAETIRLLLWREGPNVRLERYVWGVATIIRNEHLFRSATSSWLIDLGVVPNGDIWQGVSYELKVWEVLKFARPVDNIYRRINKNPCVISISLGVRTVRWGEGDIKCEFSSVIWAFLRDDKVSLSRARGGGLVTVFSSGFFVFNAHVLVNDIANITINNTGVESPQEGFAIFRGSKIS